MTTTVTVYGDGGPVDSAMGAVLAERGVRTHTVSVVTAWLGETAAAVVRTETVAGARALHEVAARSDSHTHVVATCTEGDGRSSDVRELCERCSLHHDVALLWVDADCSPAEIAAAVADVVVDWVDDDVSTGASWVPEGQPKEVIVTTAPIGPDDELEPSASEADVAEQHQDTWETEDTDAVPDAERRVPPPDDE